MPLYAINIHPNHHMFIANFSLLLWLLHHKVIDMWLHTFSGTCRLYTAYALIPVVSPSYVYYSPMSHVVKVCTARNRTVTHAYTLCICTYIHIVASLYSVLFDRFASIHKALVCWRLVQTRVHVCGAQPQASVCKCSKVMLMRYSVVPSTMQETPSSQVSGWSPGPNI